jgi:hypothetical protein|tara:strand:- start:388 stop:663 length:276 start_codon:yes stop_codon:yes gene_type:complete
MKMDDLIRAVVDSWKLDVKDMTDEYLNEDRSWWMKRFGRDDWELSDDEKIDMFDSDVHTIAIELEQIRRYGSIVYKDKTELNKEMIKDNDE